MISCFFKSGVTFIENAVDNDVFAADRAAFQQGVHLFVHHGQPQHENVHEFRRFIDVIDFKCNSMMMMMMCRADAAAVRKSGNAAVLSHDVL